MAYTRQQFVEALSRARKGARIVYHTGLLMRDRLFDRELNNTAWGAWNAYIEGRCTLIQRRIVGAEPSACEYIAVKL